MDTAPLGPAGRSPGGPEPGDDELGPGYWGGAVAALGGAPVFGSLRRIIRAGRWRHGLLLGIGLAILANSRPYEGLAASLPVAAALAWWVIGRKGEGEKGRKGEGASGATLPFPASPLLPFSPSPPLPFTPSPPLPSLWLILLPCLGVLMATGAWMAYYNYRVTGSPWQMPYQVHDATYSPVPPFIWQSPRPQPVYRHKEMHDYYAGWEYPAISRNGPPSA